MKNFLAFTLLLTLTFNLIAQETENTAVISGDTISLNSSTEINQGFQIIKSNEYKFSWFYLISNPEVSGWQIHQENNEIFLTTGKTIAEIGSQGLTNSQKKTEIISRKPVTFMILGKELNGYVLESKFKKNTKFILVSAGEVNNRSVLIQATVYSNPKNNEFLPMELKKIISFK